MNLFIIFKLALLISMGIIFLIITIAIQKSKITKRFPLLFYLRLTSWFLVLYFTTDIISIIFENKGFALVHIMLVFPFTFFFILFFNNILQQSYYSFGLIVTCCLGFLLLFLGTLPNAVKPVEEMGNIIYLPIGLFNIVNIVFYLVFISYVFFWGIKSVITSPFYLKVKSIICFIGILIYIGGFAFYFLYYINPIFNLAMYLTHLIGLLIITIVIMKEVRILYVLPYIVYRISVRDNQGNPLYDHDWTDMNLTESVFTGFLNAIEIMSEEVMHVGGILDIHLNEGIVIINKSEYVTVGLLVSKESKLLRDCVNNFTADFENKFKRFLKKSITDMNAYSSAYEFINKYFSIIPYHNIKNKSQLLTLAYNYHNIPKQIENKFKNILNEDEYKDVLNECIKLTCSNPDSYFNLYKELENELNELEFKTSKEDKKIFLE